MKIISIKKTRQSKKMLLAFFVTLVFIFGNIFSNFYFAEAAFNKQINYQGKLTDSSNVSVANGTYNMEFKLYTASSGGSAIWTETRTGADKVTVSSGLFSVLLGEVNSLAGVDFNQTLYLGVNIGGTGTPGWDGEMTPRKKLGAVPAAVMAETVTGAAQTAITSLGTLTGLTVTGSTTLRGLTVDNATATQDRIAISPAAVGANRFDGTITNADLTATRTWTLPDNSGTFALTSDIPVVTGFVPYTGATSNVDLGVHNLTVDTNSLFVDSVNHRVGMGTTSPTSALSFASNSRINSVAGNMFYGSFGDTIFEAGGASEKIRILGTNGNVGIGTNNPSSKFTVSGGDIQIVNNWGAATDRSGILVGRPDNAASMIRLVRNGATYGTTRLGVSENNAAMLYTDGGGVGEASLFAIGTTGAIPLILGTNNAERLRIDSAGNVGIGTTSPAANLHVVNSSDSESTLARFQANNVAQTDNATLKILSDPASNVISFDSTGTSSGGFRFLRGGTESIRFDSSGNIGIGITSPTAVLHLKAGTATLNTAPLKFTAGTNLTTAETGAMEYDGTNLYFTPTGTTRKTIAYTSDITGGYVPYTGATSNVDLGIHNLTVDTNSLFVDSSVHKVGIGTSTFGTAKLVVNGNLGLSGSSGTVYGPYFPDTGSHTGSLVMQAGFGSSAAGGGMILYGASNVTKPGWVTAGISQSAGSGVTEGRFTVNDQGTGGGTDVFTVLRTGNVGIGTTGPNQKLEVQGTARIQTPATAGYAEISSNANGPIYSGNGDLQFYTNNVAYASRFFSANRAAELVTILNSGNVGIGTTSPNEKLVIAGSTRMLGNVATKGLSTPSFASFGLNSASYQYGLNNSPTWNVSNGSYVNNNATAPDNTTTAGTYTLSATSYDMYQTIAATSGVSYKFGAWVKLGTATNFCVVINNSLAWNTVGGKCFTSADGLSTSDWTYISYSFVGPASGNINLHIGAHSESGVSQQTAGTVYAWNWEITKQNGGAIVSSFGGNVGIGTTAPKSPLHISGTGETDATPAIGPALNVSGPTLTNKRVGIGYNESGDYGYIWAVDHGVSWKNLILNPPNGTGNVGIGSTNPGAKLEIDDGGGIIRIGSTTNASAIYDQSAHTYQYMSTDASNTFNIWSAGGDTSLALTNSGGGKVNFSTTGTVTGTQLISNIATGTAPLVVTSTTAVTNLNADLLDGQHGAYYAPATGSGSYIQNQNTSAQTASMWISGTIRAGRPSNKVDNAGVNEFSAFEINNAFAAGQSGYVRAYYPTYNNLLFGADYDGNVGGVQPNIQFGRVGNPTLTVVNNGTGVGNVGIGTTSPNQKLSVNGNIEIQGAVGTTRYILTDETNTGTGRLVMQAGGGSAAYGGAINLYANAHATKPGDVAIGLSAVAGAKFRVNDSGLDGGADLLTVLRTGNVGIGTTSPGTMLEARRFETVNRTSYSDILTINAEANTNPYNGHGGGILFKGTTYNGGGVGVQGTRNWGRIGSYLTDASGPTTGENMFFAVAPADNSDTLSTAMTIKYNGNIGIGTTDPQVLLQVHSPSSYADVRVSNGTNTQGVELEAESGSNNTHLWNYGNGFLRFGTNNSEKVRIDSAGNVGIGSTNPGATLHVSYPTSSRDVSLTYNAAAATIIDNWGAQLAIGTHNGGAGGQPVYLQARQSANTAWNLALNPLGGNVGIGTINPSEKLNVAGNIRINNGYNLIVNDVAQNAGLNIGVTSGGTSAFIRNDNSTTLTIQAGYTTNSNNALIFNVDGATERMRIASGGKVLINATSDTSDSKLYVSGTTANNGSSSAIAGILGGYTFNPTAGGVQVGNRFVITNSPTTTANTSVGEIIRTVDNTSLANLVRGLDITSNAGSNTAGTNTGLRSSGATFGIQGITSALAGGAAVPAAIYGESTGTTQGDVLRLYSNTVTSATSFATFYHDTSTFTGTGLLMDFATGSGTFSGNFIDLQNNNATVFKVSNAGVPSVGLSATAATSAVCSSLANATAPTANTAYELRDCSGAPVADYAEMYPVEEGILYGDIVATGTDIVETYDVGANGAIDWTKVKGNISKLVKSNKAYQQNVIGIVSENTNDFSSTGYNIKEEDRPMPVALNGRVPVKISMSSSPIKVGDYITTSMEEGKGMRALKSGFVIGKALEDWTPESGKLGIMVFVEQGFYESDSAHEFASQVTFGGLTFFNASAEFAKSVKFDDTVEFTVPPLWNSDTAGFAVIKAGSNRVDITFDKPYIATPVVNTTITFDKQKNADGSVTTFDTTSFFNDDIKSVVADKDENGFSIVINKNATTDLRFSWIALAVKNPKIFESVIPGLAIDSTTTPTIPTNNLAEVPVTDLTASATPVTDTSSAGSAPSASQPTATVDNSTTTSITTTEPTTTTTSTPVETTVTPDPVSDTGATATTAPSTEGATTTTDTTTP